MIKRGTLQFFFCRFVPIVRSLISIPAGMSDMPILKFIIYTICGSVIWNATLIYVGAFAGDKKDIILNVIDKASYLILFILIIIFIVFVLWFYNRKYSNKNS